MVTMLDVEIRADPKQPHIDNINYKWNGILLVKKNWKINLKKDFLTFG